MAKTYSIKVLLDVVERSTGPLKKVGNAFSSLDRRVERMTFSLDRAGDAFLALGTKMLAFGKKTSMVGRTLTTSLSLPLALFGGKALSNWDKQEKAIAQVEQGIKTTGGAAGRTLQQLQDMASNLQEKTLFGDEEILSGATSQLLTFTNIAGKEFDRTQKVTLDVATRLAAAKGGMVDLTATSIMLGKALNDPVANLGALGKNGVQFDEQQKEMIKTMWKTGRQAEAQRLILSELEKQYGGSAEAAAKAGTGGLKQLGMAFGDLLEDIGKVIYKALIPFIIKAKEVVKQMKEWIKFNPLVTELIVKIAGIAIAIGPVLFLGGKLVSLFGGMAKGIGLLLKFLRFLIPVIYGVAKSFVMAFIAGGPILWTITAIAAAAFLIIRNWKPIARFFARMWSTIRRIFRRATRFLTQPFKDAYNFIKKIIDWIEGQFKKIEKIYKRGEAGKLESEIKNIIKSGSSMNESKTEVSIKVSSNEGSTASIERVKATKGKPRVSISNESTLGILHASEVG